MSIERGSGRTQRPAAEPSEPASDSPGLHDAVMKRSAAIAREVPASENARESLGESKTVPRARSRHGRDRGSRGGSARERRGAGLPWLERFGHPTPPGTRWLSEIEGFTLDELTLPDAPDDAARPGLVPANGPAFVSPVERPRPAWARWKNNPRTLVVALFVLVGAIILWVAAAGPSARTATPEPGRQRAAAAPTPTVAEPPESSDDHTTTGRPSPLRVTPGPVAAVEDLPMDSGTTGTPSRPAREPGASRPRARGAPGSVLERPIAPPED